jgi:hypothetical protein
MYIRIERHPNDPNQAEGIIPISDASPLASPGVETALPSRETTTNLIRPWAPFLTRSDFEVAELIVGSVMKDDMINRLLFGLGNAPDDNALFPQSYKQPYHWHNGGSSNVSLKSASDVKKALAQARKYAIQVHIVTVSCNSRLF